MKTRKSDKRIETVNQVGSCCNPTPVQKTQSVKSSCCDSTSKAEEKSQTNNGCC